jgi:hypothetical protein
MLINDILRSSQTALIVPRTSAADVIGSFQFLYSGSDSVLALSVDIGQPRQGIVPTVRQTEHLGQQSFCFQREALVPKVVIAHNGVIVGTFHTKN